MPALVAGQESARSSVGPSDAAIELMTGAINSGGAVRSEFQMARRTGEKRTALSLSLSLDFPERTPEAWRTCCSSSSSRTTRTTSWRATSSRYANAHRTYIKHDGRSINTAPAPLSAGPVVDRAAQHGPATQRAHGQLAQDPDEAGPRRAGHARESEAHAGRV